MKTKIAVVLVAISLINIIFYSSCDMKNDDPVIECDLDKYQVENSQNLADAELLENKTHGSETFKGPKYLVVNLDLNSILYPEEYTSRIWLMSLWSLAVEITARSNKLVQFQQDSQYEQVVAYIQDRLSDIENISMFAAPEKARELTPLAGTVAESVGKGVRDILVNINAFKSNKSTIKNAYGRLGTFATGLGLVLNGYQSWSDYEKAKTIANSFVVWTYFEDFIIPAIIENPIFENNSSIGFAINNYHLAPETFSQAQFDLINLGVAVDASSVLIGIAAAPIYAKAGASVGAILGVPGAVAGAVIGVAASIAIGFIGNQIDQGAEFILYNDIASRLFTLTLNSSANNNKRQSFLQAFSLFIAIDMMKQKVVGKGPFQTIGGIIGYVIPTEESKWYEFFDLHHNPHETGMNDCFKTAIDNLESASVGDGLVAYYPFNGNANDESGNGKNGNPVNSPTYGTDRFNKSNSALNLNGTNQYVSLPNSINITNDISISFWIKTSISDNGTWPSGTFLIDRDLCGSQRDWSVGIGSGGKLQFNTGKVGIDNVITSNLNINDDNWKYIVVIRNTLNQTRSLYINGQLNKSEPFDKQEFLNNSINIFVGASVCATSTHHYYGGLIDDIRIYSRVLTDSEIQQLFN